MTASEAVVEISKYLAPIIVAWLNKVRRDTNASFRKIRDLETRIDKLEEHLDDY